MESGDSVTELYESSSLTTKWLADVFKEEVSSFEVEKDAVAPEGTGTLSSLTGVTVETKQGSKIKTVAKFPCSEESVRAFVDMAGLNEREAAFYRNAAPALYRVAEPHQVNMPLIPCFLALRSPLMLEDMRPKGYRMADGLKGLSIGEAQIAMSSVARFHAAGMILTEELEDGNDETKASAMQSYLSGLLTEGVKLAQEKLLSEKNDDNEVLVQYLDSILARSEEFVDFKPQELFACVIHTDLWIYNLLFRYSDDGLANDCVLLDWQFWIPRGNAGFDVATVLFSSLNPSDYKNNANDLLECYHRHLIATLKTLGCDEDLLQRRSFEALQKHYRSQTEHVCVALLCAGSILFKMPETSERLIHVIREAHAIHVEQKQNK